MFLTREQILKADDRAYVEVACPEWGGSVRTRSLTGAERDAFEDSILGERKKNGTREVVSKNIRAKLVVLAAVDQDGKPLFSVDDVTILGEKNAAALDRIFETAKKLSGIAETDVEDLIKNSGAGQGAGLPSDSPNTSGA